MRCGGKDPRNTFTLGPTLPDSRRTSGARLHPSKIPGRYEVCSKTNAKVFIFKKTVIDKRMFIFKDFLTKL